MNIRNYIKENISPKNANQYARSIYCNQLLNNSISRSAAAATGRIVDPSKLETWEFSGFSQNGEDGIIDYLLAGVTERNKYFIEIGSGNGLENNTAYLAHVKKYSGLQVEGDKYAYEDSLLIKPWLVETMNCFVDKTNVLKLLDKSLYKNPDVFSIDIDGMDYHILQQFLENGLRAKIIIVEYNSAFGPERSITIPYQPNFDMFKSGHPYLYYGVSLKAWNKLLLEYGYEFITVETNGVNAFFIRPDDFIDGFFNKVQGMKFKENMHQLRLFKRNWKAQFEIMQELPFIEI